MVGSGAAKGVAGGAAAARIGALGRGAEAFASVGPQLRTGARPYAIQAADLNGDGRAELTVSSQNSHQMNLWIGRAGAEPGFSAAPDLGVGTGPLDCLFCDLDGDGVAELITTNAFSDDLSVVSFR